MQHINAKVQQTIRKVEKGEFDSVLKKLEGSPLGIYANACVVEGEVVPMPAGYAQSESALEISVTNERDTDAIQVGWVIEGQSDCFNCVPCCHAHSRVRGERPLQSVGAACQESKPGYHVQGERPLQSVGAVCKDMQDHIDKLPTPQSVGAMCLYECNGGPPGRPLQHAREIDPVAIAQSIEGHADLLANLAIDGLGIFMVHGHTEDVEFVELPAGFMSVIENNKTSFRERESVLNSQRFVPNVWRFENGARQPVGGFVV